MWQLQTTFLLNLTELKVLVTLYLFLTPNWEAENSEWKMARPFENISGVCNTYALRMYV